MWKQGRSALSSKHAADGSRTTIVSCLSGHGHGGKGEAGLKSTLTDVLHSRPLGNCHGLIGIEHPRDELRPVKGHGQGAVKEMREAGSYREGSRRKREEVKKGKLVIILLLLLPSHSPNFDKDTRRNHEYVIKRHQIRHGQRHRVEGRREEDATGSGHIHDQHHTGGRHGKGIERGTQTR